MLNNMTAHALLFTLACIGISETVYLIRKRWENEKPVCYIGGSCGVVLSSKWNKIFGIHNDILGLFFYVTLSVITAFLVIGVEPVLLWEKIAYAAIGSGALMSVYFVFLQWKVIKVWCFWCLMSAATIALMTVIVLTSTLIIK